MRKIILFIIFILCVGVVSAGPYCYQETANISTACGGLNTGSYYSNGTWDFPVEFLYDGDWSTGSQSLSTGVNSTFYINYSIPTNANGSKSLWQLRKFSEPSVRASYNLSLTNCSIANSKLQFKFVSLDYDTGWWLCLNTSSNWTVLINNSLFNFGGTMFEEAMYWYMNPSISNISITPTVAYRNDSLQGFCNATATSNITVLNYSWYKNGALNSSGSYLNYVPCFQESFNISNQTGLDGSCGLNYTGSFSVAYNTSGGQISMYDGDYGTYYHWGSTSEIHNVTYNVPSTFSNISTIIWTIYASTDIDTVAPSYYNYVVPISCVVNNSLKLQHYFYNIDGHHYFKCVTGTIVGDTNPDLVDFFEESITWGTSRPIIDGTLYNLANFSNTSVKNDNITFSCNAYDGLVNSGFSSVSNIIQNSVPIMVSSRFNPNSSVYKNTSIQGLCLATDADNDSLYYNATLYINGTINSSIINTYNANCYQENANGSKTGDGVCELNYSGTYAVNGSWSNQGNLYDGSWSTQSGAGNAGECGTGLFINYSKPNGVTNLTQWEIMTKYLRANYTIDVSNMSVVQLKVCGGNDNPYHIYGYVLNNSNWSLLFNSSSTTDNTYRFFYEEAMHWNTTTQVLYNQSIELNYFNLSNVSKNTNLTIECKANDLTTFSNTLNSSIRILNSIPTFNESNFYSVWTHLLNISLQINASDIDGDVINYSMNILPGFSINQSGVVSKINNVSTTGNYNASINISDGDNVSSMWVFFQVTNNAPTVSVSILNKPIADLQNINVSYNSSDIDNDSITVFESKWYINNVYNSSFDNSTFINNSFTSNGESWNITLRVFDGANWSSWISDEIVIGDNVPPNITYISVPSSVITASINSIYINCSDVGSMIQSVTMKVRLPTLVLDNTQVGVLQNGSTYRFLYQPLAQGNYTFFNATCSDMSGNTIVNTSNYSMIVTDAPVTPPSGGGGGTVVVQENLGTIGNLLIEPSMINVSISRGGTSSGEIKLTNTGLLNKNISISLLSDGLITFDQDVTNLIIPASSGIVSNYIYLRYTIHVPVNASINSTLTSEYKITDLSTSVAQKLVFNVKVNQGLYELLQQSAPFFSKTLYSTKICLEPDTCATSYTLEISYGYALFFILLIIVLIVFLIIRRRKK